MSSSQPAATATPGWSTQLRGTAPRPEDKILWKLAWFSYGEHLPYAAVPWDPQSQPPLPPGWAAVGEDALSEAGLDADALDDHTTGFRAMVFRDGAGHHVIAYRGTNDRLDWEANIDQGAGRDAAQFDEAMALAVLLRARTGDDLVLTGHSLGGGLAAAAAMATGLTAVTFDASGVHRHTAASAARLRGPELTGLQESRATPDLPAAQGTPIVLPVVDEDAQKAWARHGRRSGPVVGAVVAGALSGFNPVAAGLGAVAGAKAGSDAFTGLHGHLYHAIDAGMEALLPDGSDDHEP